MDLIFIYVLKVVFVIVASQENFPIDSKIAEPALPDLAPLEPLNVTLVKFNSTSAELLWSAPEDISGPVEGYRIYFGANNYSHIITLKPENAWAKRYEYTVTDLIPNTEYYFFVKSYFGNLESNASNIIIQSTDISGPSAPKIVKFACLNSGVIALEWQRPNAFYGNIKVYSILIFVDSKLYDNITIPTSKKFIQGSVSIFSIRYGSTLNADIKFLVKLPLEF